MLLLKNLALSANAGLAATTIAVDWKYLGISKRTEWDDKYYWRKDKPIEI